MDFQFSEEQERFRGEVRAFIAEQAPNGEVDEPELTAQPEVLAWQKALARKGWLTPAWPKQYGGLDASHWEQLLLKEELALGGAPPSTNMGTNWVGPALMVVGSEEQKATHVSRIVEAADNSWWCTLYSEPGAGSDLASLQTRAVEDGDEFVVNGQKIWTSGAHHSDWGWLAARTDPEAPKHRGISMFIVDMHTPGISTRPLVNMADDHSFNEVYMEDVRIPRDNLVGEQNRGWYHLAMALDFERSSIASFAGSRRLMERYVADARSRPEWMAQRPLVRLSLGDRLTEIEVGTLLAYRIVHMQSAGAIPNHEASAGKLFGSELEQRIASTAMSQLGLYGQLTEDAVEVPFGGAVGRRYLRSPSRTIAGGTSEVQRNVIATRGLGLPRG